MTIEEKLISKTFYQTLIVGNGSEHPIKVLGDMFMEEEHNEMPDLSPIRFAQGEVYFFNKDFEAAIFKWENISGDLRPWALKNLADAHCELNLLAIAEDYYHAVETESINLKTEVLLELFSLYIQFGKLDRAVHVIKEAVTLNPDYSDVTALARTFFEDHQDWDNAVELAVNEAIRTGVISWFSALEAYVEQGHTVKIDPGYFGETLLTLYRIDHSRFENLAAAFWRSYKQSDLYFSWLKVFNDLLLNIQPEPYTWTKLSSLYKETYFELINGKYLISDFSYLIPSHLTNWLNISNTSAALISSAAVLSWSEAFPSDLETALVNQAEHLLGESPRSEQILEDVYCLFDSIKQWAQKEGVLLNEQADWMIRELFDFDHSHLLISGPESVGDMTFVNMLIEEGFMDNGHVSVGNSELVERESQVHTFGQSPRNRQALIPCKLAANKNKPALVDDPIVVDQRTFKNDEFPYVHLSDCLLFVLNTDTYLTGRDLEIAIRMKEQTPELPVHFLLWKRDQRPGTQEEMERVQKMVSLIDSYFPNAKVSAFSTNGDREIEWSQFIQSLMEGQKPEKERTIKILHNIKQLITSLLDQRVEMENTIIDRMGWTEDVATKLKGAQNQLSDMAEQKARLIKESYSHLKNDLRQSLVDKIPELLRNCSDLVKENSDFSKVHIELNDVMNQRVTSFIEDTALPRFRKEIFEWIQGCESEFLEIQSYLDEMSEGFNLLYGEEKVALNCDFKVLEDWRRDVDRMTRSNIQLTKANILLRTTPSQLLLKGAGKLLGALSKNKEMLLNKYKQFIDSKDYSQIAESITEEFMLSFELFEKSLERDMSMFFAAPVDVLNKTIEEVENTIEENKESLNHMRENPEVFHDPLTLFGLKLRQFEWIETEVKDGSPLPFR